MGLAHPAVLYDQGLTLRRHRVGRKHAGTATRQLLWNEQLANSFEGVRPSARRVL